MIQFKSKPPIARKKLFEIEPKAPLGTLPPGINHGIFADKLMKAVKKAGWVIEKETWTVNDATTSMIGVLVLGQSVGMPEMTNRKLVFAIMHSNNCQCHISALYGITIDDAGTIFWGAEGYITTTHYAEIPLEKFLTPIIEHMKTTVPKLIDAAGALLSTKVPTSMSSHFLMSTYDSPWIGIPHLKKIYLAWKEEKSKTVADLLACISRSIEDMSAFTSYETAAKIRGAIASVFKLPQLSLSETRVSLNPFDRTDRSHTVAGRWAKPEVTKAIRDVRKKKIKDATPVVPKKDAPRDGTNKQARTAAGKRKALAKKEGTESTTATSAVPKGITTKLTGKKDATPEATTPAAPTKETKPKTTKIKTTTPTPPVEPKPAKPRPKASKPKTEPTTTTSTTQPAPEPAPAAPKKLVLSKTKTTTVSEEVEPEPEPEVEVAEDTPPAAPVEEKKTKPRPKAKK